MCKITFWAALPEKSWPKILTFAEKECVKQKWFWAANKGEKKDCPSLRHRSGPKHFKFSL